MWWICVLILYLWWMEREPQLLNLTFEPGGLKQSDWSDMKCKMGNYGFLLYVEAFQVFPLMPQQNCLTSHTRMHSRLPSHWEEGAWKAIYPNCVEHFKHPGPGITGFQKKGVMFSFYTQTYSVFCKFTTTWINLVEISKGSKYIQWFLLSFIFQSLTLFFLLYQNQDTQILQLILLISDK